MRQLLVTCVALLAGAALTAPTASAQGVGLPLTSPATATQPPPGFTSNALQAEAAAKASPQMQALHRRERPLRIDPLIWSGRRWFVDFSYRGRIVAEADVDPAGNLLAVWIGPYATAVYTHGHYAPIFDSPWVVIPFSLAFLLPFLTLRRRLVVLDGLVILSFLVSYALFDHRQLALGVWMAYPPLLYLMVRMAWIGLRGRPVYLPAVRLHPHRVLWIGLLALVGARIGLSLADHEVIDVGYASVIGAHRMAHGLPLYFASASHGDTYGPIAYLAYLPFELIWPWHGVWDYLPAAHAASIAFDLLTIAGLVALGRRLRGGRDGMHLGLMLGFAWAACPFTLLALMMHTNDELVSLLSVGMLLVYSSPVARGAVLGVAAAAKFTPAALLGVVASPRQHGWRACLACAAAFGAVAFLAVGLYLPPGGISEFYSHTIGYQLHRPDVFSLWALHPGLAPLKIALSGLALAFGAALAFWPREGSLMSACALCAAVTIAVELPAVHWFYYYIVWFLPFVLVVALTPTRAEDPPPVAFPQPVHDPVQEPVLVGV